EAPAAGAGASCLLQATKARLRASANAARRLRRKETSCIGVLRSLARSVVARSDLRSAQPRDFVFGETRGRARFVVEGRAQPRCVVALHELGVQAHRVV